MPVSEYDLSFYLEADRLALRRPPWPLWKVLLRGDVIWQFQTALRICEYLDRLPRPPLSVKMGRRVFRWWLERQKVKLAFSIPLHVFGPGLSIAHYGTIVVNENARIGANCRIHVDVNIGSAAGAPLEAPTLGDNIYIGPGAKLYGAIHIASGIAIGANSVVNKDFLEANISIAGVPARKISEGGSHGLLIRATEGLTATRGKP
ncbi:serine acetyltransferase [bacterium]|nr:serine acetyltransferase [bacterium]